MPVHGGGGGGGGSGSGGDRGSGTPGPSSSATLGLELFGSVAALQSRSDHAKALDVLRRAAAQVKPVMKRRGWRVRRLEEFYPKNPTLLGLNHNRGAKIQVRVRSPSDPAGFLPFDSVLGTLLHELTHIKHGPHDVAFYKLLDEITAETEELIANGYTGEGFYSHGTRLGNVNVPTTQVRGAAAAAAEKRMKLAAIMARPGGQRLGGNVDRETLRRHTPAQMAAMAAQRRANDALWCGNLEDGGEVEVEQDDRGRTVTFAPDDDEGNAAGAAAGPAAGTEKAGSTESAVTGSEAMRKFGADKLKGTPFSPSAPTAAPPAPAGSPKRRKRAGVEGEGDPPFWICGTCSLKNQGVDVLCEACSTARPDRPPGDSADFSRDAGEPAAGKAPSRRGPSERHARAGPVCASPMWTCPLCTFAGNPGPAPACDVCGTARATVPPEEARKPPPQAAADGREAQGQTDGAADARRPCPACTFAGNAAGARSCEMCGTPLAPAPDARPPRHPDGGILVYTTSDGDSVWVCPVCTTETATDYRACRGCVFVRRV